MQGPPQNRPELYDVNGLVEDVVGPPGNRFQGVLLLGAARDDDDLDERVDGKRLREGRKPFLDARGVGRQAQVQDHDGRPFLAQLGKRRFPVFGQHDLAVRGQRPFHLGPDVVVVLDDQQGIP